MKKIVKKFKPVYTVDLTACNDSVDACWEFVFAKAQVGLPVSVGDIECILEDAIAEAMDRSVQAFSILLDEELDSDSEFDCSRCERCKCCNCQAADEAEKKKKSWWQKLMFWKD